MGYETNRKSVRGLRRLFRSKTQVIFLDASEAIKSGISTLSRECGKEPAEGMPQAERAPDVCKVRSDGERMFSFKKLLETFSSLERKTEPRMTSESPGIDVIDKDIISRRRLMFDCMGGNGSSGHGESPLSPKAPRS